MTSNQARSIYFISIAVLLIIYGVGLVGFHTDFRLMMIRLTPYTLLLSFILILINHRGWDRFFVSFIWIAYLIGFVIEVLGVSTGWIFGSYEYGASLGYKMFDVPLLIGINWFILVYSSGTIANLIHTGNTRRAIIGALLMVIFDIALEPIAVKLDFWKWENNLIPLQNYIAWFCVAFIIQFFFQQLVSKKINRLAIALFIIQWIFFLALSIII